jgi:hypothetical protein
MKIITADSGWSEYLSIFEEFHGQKLALILWQLMPETGSRVIVDAVLSQLELTSPKLLLTLTRQGSIRKDLPLYCYSSDQQLIFRSQILDVQGQTLTISIPSEMKLLEGPEIEVLEKQLGLKMQDLWRVKRGMADLFIDSDVLKVKSMAERSGRDQDFLHQEFNLTVDQEDRLFADKRESPRARPKVDKWVKIQKAQEDHLQFFRLFDLSQGGMSFIVTDPSLFPKGVEVHIKGFDEFDLDDPLIGHIVSSRPINETNSEFKVGVKFSEGQN